MDSGIDRPTLKVLDGGRVDEPPVAPPGRPSAPNDPLDALQRAIDAPRDTVTSWPGFILRSFGRPSDP